MEQKTDDLVTTRSTFANRSEDWGDRDGLEEFSEIHRRLIFGSALRAGLTEQEAEDVLQETLISAARTIREFKHDRKRCTFKSWLRHLTQKQIAECARKRPGQQAGARPATRRGPATPATGRVPDPNWMDLEQIWEEEWRQKLLDAAVGRVRSSVDPGHYQMWELSVVRKLPAGEVAGALGANIGQVYLAKHRVSKLIKREVQSLETRLG
jgi:RNA polymerase sigma factor (sigma-70 family)